MLKQRLTTVGPLISRHFSIILSNGNIVNDLRELFIFLNIKIGMRMAQSFTTGYSIQY